MKIYGSGQLRLPGTSRVIWDFEDGPFDTVNQEVLAHARQLGLQVGDPPPVENVVEQFAEPVKARRGRPKKEAAK